MKKLLATLGIGLLVVMAIGLAFSLRVQAADEPTPDHEPQPTMTLLDRQEVQFSHSRLLFGDENLAQIVVHGHTDFGGNLRNIDGFRLYNDYFEVRVFVFCSASVDTPDIMVLLEINNLVDGEWQHRGHFDNIEMNHITEQRIPTVTITSHSLTMTINGEMIAHFDFDFPLAGMEWILTVFVGVIELYTWEVNE